MHADPQRRGDGVVRHSLHHELITYARRDGVALRHDLGIDRRHDSRRDCGRARRHGPDLGAVRRAGRTARRARSTLPGSGTTPRSGCTCTTATSTSRPSTPGFKIRGVPINVNYRYLDDELWYLLDNADAEALVFHSSLGDRVAQVVDRLPQAQAVDRGRRRRQPARLTAPSRYDEVLADARADGAHRRAAKTTSTCSTPAAPPACRRA